MQSLLKLSPTVMLSRRVLYFASAAIHRFSILQSLYHSNGPLQLRRHKKIEQLLQENCKQLDHKMQEIEKYRLQLMSQGIHLDKENVDGLIEISGVAKSYINCYQEFVKIFQKSHINNQWIFKILGWYNVTFYYKHLLERLLDSKNEETIYLIETLSWMKYEWNNPYGVIDEDLRENRRVQKFYKELPYDLTLEQLKKLEKIIVAPLTFTKRRYYERYLANNLENMLKVLQPSNNEAISNLIWLFNNCIISMVDQDYLIYKFEKYLLLKTLPLSTQDLEHLLSIYTMKGRINKNIYSMYLKPFILKHKMKNMSNIIQTIKFVICSECDDNSLLKNLYELLYINYRKGSFQSNRDLYDLHLYTHYLRIKGYKIKLNVDLERDLTHFCKERARSKDSLNKMVYDIQMKNQGNNTNKYISDCLNVKKLPLIQSEPTRRSVFEELFKKKILNLRLQQMQIYEKPSFCCFELDFCLKKKDSDQMMDVEVEGLQYVFASSGRLIRYREIRDEMLTHYGFKVNHFDYNNTRAHKRVTQDIYLMNNRINKMKV